MIVDPGILDDCSHRKLEELLRWCDEHEGKAEEFMQDMVSGIPWEDGWETYDGFVKPMQNLFKQFRYEVRCALERNQARACRVADRLRESA